MIIRSTIDSECKGQMYYLHTNMGKTHKEYLPRYKTRLSDYQSEQLIKDLQKDPNTRDIYIYKINYADGGISLIANPNKPLGKLMCEDDD